MRRWFGRVLLLPLLGLAAACGQKDPFLPTGPTTPPTVRSDTFSGVLTKNSAYTHPFAVNDAGDVSVFLITSADSRNADDNAVPLGLLLGTWNSFTSSCSTVVSNDNIKPGASIAGRATAAGNLCVRVYDVGFVSGAVTYELLVDHF